MNILQGSFVIVGLGTSNPQYLFNGIALQGITKIFVYKGVSVTLTCNDKNILPLDELKAYGIKVKEAK